MKHETYNNIDRLYIKCLDKELTTFSISKDDSYPILTKEIKNIVLDLNCIKNVDATGLSWLLGFAKKISNTGYQLYLTQESHAFKCLEFLGVDSHILPFNQINHKEAI